MSCTSLLWAQTNIVEKTLAETNKVAGGLTKVIANEPPKVEKNTNDANAKATAAAEEKKRENRKKELDYVSSTFKWGTYEQQMGALSKFKNNQYLPGKDDEFYKALDILAGKLESDMVAYPFFEIILIQKLEKYYPLIPQYLYKTIENQDKLSTEKVTTICYGLSVLAKLSNVSHIEIATNFYLDEKFHKGNAKVIAEAIGLIGSLKPSGFSETLKKSWEEYENDAVRIKIVSALTAYKDPADLPFLDNIIFDEVNSLVIRWIAIVSLKDYAPNEEALAILKECYASDDINLKSRALYALSFFNLPDMKETIYTACKSASYPLRFQAVKALEQYTDDETNELLMYKHKFDPEFAIKNEAKRMLLARGLIEDEDKKEKEKKEREAKK